MNSGSMSNNLFEGGSISLSRSSGSGGNNNNNNDFDDDNRAFAPVSFRLQQGDRRRGQERRAHGCGAQI